MKTNDVVQVAAGTFLIFIGAYIAVPIGPVPVVLTNFFIIIIGLLLGWKKSLLAVTTYIVLGAIGLPVFSNGRGGMAHLLGLTGGFLFGFMPLALLAGLGYRKNIIIKITLVIAGSIVVYLIGVPWAMYVYNNIIAPGADKPLWDLGITLKYTTFPFLLPDLIKIATALAVVKVLEPAIKPFIKTYE